MDELIKEVANLIARSNKIVAFTGAGISVESGIPPFRGREGLWAKYNPEEYATVEAFMADPAKVWHMIKELSEIIFDSQPNPAHSALAELEKMGKLSSVITQNVDGLHQKGGSINVIELHGNNRHLLCIDCKKAYPVSRRIIQKIPPLCSCGGILRPDVVFFGEALPQDALLQASHEASSADLLLLIGTSVIIYPASSIPILAKQAGAVLVEINTEGTLITDNISDFLLKGMAGKIMPAIVKAVRKKL